MFRRRPQRETPCLQSAKWFVGDPWGGAGRTRPVGAVAAKFGGIRGGHRVCGVSIWVPVR